MAALWGPLGGAALSALHVGLEGGPQRERPGGWAGGHDQVREVHVRHISCLS